MSSVNNVAADILGMTGPTKSKQLYALLYYSQAWHLAWYGVTLFPESIEALKSGVRISCIYQRLPHDRRWFIEEWPHGNRYHLTVEQHQLVREVVRAYSVFNAHDIGLLIQEDGPWIEARHGLETEDAIARPMKVDSIYRFYRNIVDEELAACHDAVRMEG